MSAEPGLATITRPFAGLSAAACIAGQNHVDESEPAGASAGIVGTAVTFCGPLEFPNRWSPIKPAASSAMSTTTRGRPNSRHPASLPARTIVGRCGARDDSSTHWPRPRRRKEPARWRLRRLIGSRPLRLAGRGRRRFRTTTVMANSQRIASAASANGTRRGCGSEAHLFLRHRW